METLGPYQILRELGRGGCGAVYLALDPRISRKVAIKTVLPVSDASLSDSLRARFRREAQAAGGLSHPHIVTIHEYDDSATLAYLVMEYVEGSTLAQKMAEGSLSLEFTLSVLDAASAALDFAHARNVVHRDVKPANFLIANSGFVKIADFGIAKIMDADTGNLTTTGTVVGTVQYMSPEQVAARPVSGRSDQFSLAVIAYEMLAGRKPFTGDSWASVLHQIMSVDPAPLRQFREDLDNSLTAVLRKALSKEADDRYPTCESFVRELREASGLVSNTERTVRLPAAAGPATGSKIGVPTARMEAPTVTIASKPPQPASLATSAAPPRNPGAVRRAVLMGGAAVALLAAAVIGYRFWISRPAPGPVASIAPGPPAESTATAPAAPGPKKSAPSAPVVSPQNPPLVTGKTGAAPPDRQPVESQPLPAPEPLPATQIPAPQIPRPSDQTQAPPLPAPAPPQPAPAAARGPENRVATPDPRALEAAAWEKVRASTDIVALERFRASFPNGSFSAEAGRRVEQLEFEQLSRVNTAKAYRDFLARYPSGPYSERANAELAKLDRAGQAASNRRLVDAALQTYKQAFERKDAVLLKSVWPSLSPADLSSFQNFFRIARSVKLDLQLTGDPDITADGATVKCRRILTATDERGPLPAQDQMVTIRLRKSGDAMLIESVQTANR